MTREMPSSRETFGPQNLCSPWSRLAPSLSRCAAGFAWSNVTTHGCRSSLEEEAMRVAATSRIVTQLPEDTSDTFEGGGSAG